MWSEDMKLKKKQLNNYVARMYRLLDKHGDKIHFKKLTKNQGYHIIGYENDWWIEIDYKQQIFPTLWHEALHQWHPNWKHKDIYAMERAIVNSLSERQVRNVIKKLGKCL